MTTKIFALIAILTAIPTYGVSLIVWLILKHKYDKFCATKVLINSAVISYKNFGEKQVLYGVNNAAIKMLFFYFGGEIITNIKNSTIGVLPHPVNGLPMVVTLTQVSGNRLLIKATNVTD